MEDERAPGTPPCVEGAAIGSSDEEPRSRGRQAGGIDHQSSCQDVGLPGISVAGSREGQHAAARERQASVAGDAAGELHELPWLREILEEIWPAYGENATVTKLDVAAGGTAALQATHHRRKAVHVQSGSGYVGQIDRTERTERAADRGSVPEDHVLQRADRLNRGSADPECSVQDPGISAEAGSRTESERCPRHGRGGIGGKHQGASIGDAGDDGSSRNATPADRLADGETGGSGKGYGRGSRYQGALAPRDASGQDDCPRSQLDETARTAADHVA